MALRNMAARRLHLTRQVVSRFKTGDFFERILASWSNPLSSTTPCQALMAKENVYMVYTILFYMHIVCTERECAVVRALWLDGRSATSISREHGICTKTVGSISRRVARKISCSWFGRFAAQELGVISADRGITREYDKELIYV